MKKDITNLKQEIINTAKQLFYKQGYNSTGINQIIAESGYAKNTFYYYFPSKEDLCVAYLQDMDNDWKKLLKAKIDECKTPYDKVFAPLEFLKSWNSNNNYLGCPFINISSEIQNSNSKIHKEVVFHKDAMRSIIRELLKDLKNSNKKYSSIDVTSLTGTYYLIAEGAIVASKNYQESWPYEQAKESFERILNPK